MPPAKAKGARFEHGSVLGGKTRAARVSSQWKSTPYTLVQQPEAPLFLVKVRSTGT
jgi:hypothetical protein